VVVTVAAEDNIVTLFGVDVVITFSAIDSLAALRA
jgi:hypothetical protein